MLAGEGVGCFCAHFRGVCPCSSLYLSSRVYQSCDSRKVPSSLVSGCVFRTRTLIRPFHLGLLRSPYLLEARSQTSDDSRETQCTSPASRRISAAVGSRAGLSAQHTCVTQATPNDGASETRLKKPGTTRGYGGVSGCSGGIPSCGLPRRPRRWAPDAAVDWTVGGTRWESSLFRDVTLGNVEYVVLRAFRGVLALFRRAVDVDGDVSRMYPLVVLAFLSLSRCGQRAGISKC